jgi:hypothetical protein
MKNLSARLLALVLAMLVLFAAAPVRAQEPISAPAPIKATVQSSDEQATAVASRFLLAFKARDVNGMLALADAPWYEERENPIIVTHVDLLREHFQRAVDRLTNSGGLAAEPTKVLTYGPARRQLKGSHHEKYLIAQDHVFRWDDRIVIFGDPDATNSVAIGVRFRDGKASVAALFR